MRVTYLINKKIYSILFSIGCGFAFFLALLPVRSRTILYHDEVFDFQPIRQLVSSCSDVPESLHTPLLFGCLPLWASNGYQGTLRGYLFYPLIKLQALTPQSALLIYSLCLAITTYVLLELTSQFFTEIKWQYLVVFTVIINPLVWTLFAFDLGPVTTQFLLRSLILFSVWRDIKQDKIFSRWTLILCIFLIWGKLDGLWFVVGTVIGCLLLARRTTNIIPLMRKSFPMVMVLGIGSLFAYQAGKYLPGGLNFHWQTRIFTQIPTDLLNGCTRIIFPSEKGIGRIWSLPLNWLMLLALIAPLISKQKTKSPIYGFFRILRVQSIVLMIFLLISPQATAPWHTVSLWPSFGILIVLWLILVKREIPNSSTKTWFYRTQLSFLAASVLIALCSSGIDYYKMLRNPMNPLFSKSLAEAFDRIPANASKSHAWVFTTWGTYNPVILDNSIKNQIQLASAVDFWAPFTIKNTKSREEYFRWALRFGPLARYTSFTFVEFNPENSGEVSTNTNFLGSRGMLNTFSPELGVCNLRFHKYSLAESKANFVTLDSVRCQ